MRGFFCLLLGRDGLVVKEDEEEEGEGGEVERRGGEKNLIPPRLLLWGMVDRARRGRVI